MKPFNIADYIAGKEIVTRGGRRVEIIRTDLPSHLLPVIAIVYDDERISSPAPVWTDSFNVHRFHSNGAYVSSQESVLDLMIKVEYAESWVNMSRGSDGKAYIGSSYTSAEAARIGADFLGESFIKTIHIKEEV